METLMDYGPWILIFVSGIWCFYELSQLIRLNIHTRKKIKEIEKKKYVTKLLIELEIEVPNDVDIIDVEKDINAFITDILSHHYNVNGVNIDLAFTKEAENKFKHLIYNAHLLKNFDTS